MLTKSKVTWLNDYWLVALMSIVIKSFERLVMTYISSCFRQDLDPVQFACRHNGSIVDTIMFALHSHGSLGQQENVRQPIVYQIQLDIQHHHPLKTCCQLRSWIFARPHALTTSSALNWCGSANTIFSLLTISAEAPPAVLFTMTV